MLSVTAVNAPIPNPFSLSSKQSIVPHFLAASASPTHKPPPPPPISAIIIPSTSSNPSPQPQQQQLYQPFRPPPSPLPPKYRSLDTPARLDILCNRLGLWFEYAPLIPSLIQEGFTPSTLEELTGITGVQQNCLVVAAQVRDSLIQSQIDPETLSFFETGGSELLYEIRLLSASQRAAAARYVVQNKLDAKGAQELARAMKDFPRRRGDRGWESFDYVLPADCLSFMYYRQAQEHRNPSEQRTAMLRQALEVAGSEAARNRVLQDLEGREGDGDEADQGGGVEEGVRVRVPVVRMMMGEVAEATSVVVLPVCRAEERESELEAAPWECGTEGEFGVVAAEKGWNRWVVLPSWEPVARLQKGKGGVVVAFPDARALPWRTNRWYKEEPILVVADRGRKEVVAEEGFYLVVVNGSLKVERGLALKQGEGGAVKETLGTVVLVVRPPREDTDEQLSEEDWE